MPVILQNNAANWTAEVMAYHIKGELIPENLMKRYGHAEVKAAVIRETKDKCAYCESCVTSVYYGDIEHILPKSKYPELAFDWENLTFVCNKCNNSKRDYASRNVPLLNPYKDDIQNHISAFGPMIMHINNSERGKITHLRLKLNRPKLIEKRTEAIEKFSNVLDAFNEETDEDIKEIYSDQLYEMMESKNEYAFTLICYAKANGFIQ